MVHLNSSGAATRSATPATEPAEPLPRGDECLGVVGGELALEQVRCLALAREFGTPLTAVSEDQLRTNARRWRAALALGWPHGRGLVMPSIKANYCTALRAILTEEGMGCDVFGASELELALRGDVPPARVSLNGATKSDAVLERAVGAGARITLDSADEFERTAAIAARLGRVAEIRFRIRPRLDERGVRSDFDGGTVAAADAISAYRAGMPWHEVLACFDRLASIPQLVLTGLMAHLTRQSTDLGLWASFGRALGDATGELAGRRPGWRPRELDVGGGFAVPRDPLLRTPELAPAPEEYLAATGGALAGRLSDRGVDPGGIALEVEPGRALYGNAGIHIATVLHVKRERAPQARTWIETDTSEAFLPDTVIEGNHWRVLLADDVTRPATLEAAVTGVSCGWDVLVTPSLLPEPRAGERLVFLDCGAYQDAAASNFNALLRPPTVLVSGATAELVRERERLDEIVARDRVPERLRAA